MKTNKTVSVELNAVNSNDIAKRLESLQLTEKSEKGNKDAMYKFQLDKSKRLDSDSQKKLRTKIRKELNTLMFNIVFNTKKKNEDRVKQCIKEFLQFYKSTYIVNDFSLKSLYSGNEESKVFEYTLALDIVKLHLSKEEKKEKKNKEVKEEIKKESEVKTE